MNYVSSFKNMINSKVENVLQGSSPKTRMLSCLNEFKKQLSLKTAALDNFFMSLMTSISGLDVPDISELKGIIDRPDVSVSVQIDGADARDIIDNLIYSLEQSGKTPNQDGSFGCIINDSNGIPFQFLIDDPTAQYPRIKTTLLNSESVNTILWYDSRRRRWYFNPYIRSIGYYNPDETSGHYYADNVHGGLIDLAEWMDYPTDNIHDIADPYLSYYLVEFVNPGAGIDPTGQVDPDEVIFDNLEQLALYYNASVYEDDSLQTINSIIDEFIDAMSGEPYGSFTTVWDLIKSLSVSSTLNQGVIEVIDVLNTNISSLTSLITRMKNYTESSVSSVRNFGENVVSAYNLGGWYGLVNFIISFIRAQANISSTTDGKLTFTDNTKLVPAEYIGGLILNLAESLVNAVSMLVTAIQPVIGLAMNLIGNIILLPFKAVKYDYETSTHMAINLQSDTGIMLSCYPFAACQGTLNKTDIMHNGLYKELFMDSIENGVFYQINVPGGMLLCGPGDSDCINFEFHPSLLHGRWSYAYRFALTGIPYYDTAKAVYTNQMTNLSSSAMEQWWADNATPYNVNFIDGSDTLIDDDSESNLFRFAVANVAAFFMWLHAIESSSQYVLSGYYGVFRRSLTNPNIVVPDEDFSFDDITEMIAYDVDDNTVAGYRFRPTPDWASLINLCSQTNNPSSFTTETLPIKFVNYTYPNPGERTANIYYTFSIHLNVALQTNLFYQTENLYFCQYGPSSFSFEATLPKYNAKTFFAWVLFASITTVVVIAGTLIATVAMKKWANRKKAENHAKVANSYEEYQESMKDYDPDDPDDDPSKHTVDARKEAYSNYYKEVRKNNVWASVLGGTKFSKTGYWDEVSYESGEDSYLCSVLSNSQAVDPATGSTTPKDLASPNYITEPSQQSGAYDPEYDIEILGRVSRVQYLITGVNPNPDNNDDSNNT